MRQVFPPVDGWNQETLSTKTNAGTGRCSFIWIFGSRSLQPSIFFREQSEFGSQPLLPNFNSLPRLSSFPRQGLRC